MPDFNVRSDAVNVEQIMEEIRARIREKRGVDYTDAQIKELASVKLEKFLDPRGVRSDLLEQFRRAQPTYAPPELPNFAFEDQTLFESTRGPLRFIRKLLLPILKLFFNPNPLIQALNIQSKLNAGAAEREAKRDAARYAFDQLHYEVMHNLVIETTRLGIEVKNLTMRLESLASRLEFNERRARALESAVVYKPSSDEREGRRDEGRRDESRRDESRRDDGRRDDNRREDNRRQDSRRQEQGQPRPQPPQPPAPVPAPAASPSTDASAPQAQAVQVQADAPSGAAPGVVNGEGPGQRSRRRRRRRGRRGGGSAAALMGAPGSSTGEGTSGSEPGDLDQGDEGEFDAEAPETAASNVDLDLENLAPAVTAAAPATAGAEPEGPPAQALPASSETADSREARPVPFEHAFGAEAHPAEPAISDPAHAQPPVAPAHTQPEAPDEKPTSPDPSAAPEQ